MRINSLTFISFFILLTVSACDSAVIDTDKVQNTQSTSTKSVQEFDKPKDKNSASTNEIKHTLWKVKGETNTLYLLGSIHLMPPELYPLPKPYNDAFEDAEKVVFEIDESIQDQKFAQQTMLKYAKPSNGQSLSDLMDSDEYAEIRKLAKENNVPMLMIDPFDPWFSSITLIGLQYLNAGLSPEHGIDQHFMRKAQEAGKPILGLETLDDQFGMFDSVSMEVQTEMLLETLKQEVDMQVFVDQMLEDWQTGDMEGLEALLMDEFDEAPELYDAMLVNRNLNWIQQFQPMLKDTDDYLVVVGAAHMLGKDGVVELLQAQGYSVEQL